MFFSRTALSFAGRHFFGRDFLSLPVGGFFQLFLPGLSVIRLLSTRGPLSLPDLGASINIRFLTPAFPFRFYAEFCSTTCGALGDLLSPR